MATDTQPVAASEHQVVDLRPLSAACRDLVGWYDLLIAGAKPPIQDLDRALATLQLLPRVGGRLGRDIDLIIAGGASSSHEEVIGAVERLRTIANHSPAPASRSRSTEPPRRGRRRRPAKRPGPAQAPLPGLEPYTDDENKE
jgi:hypothetical protein